MIAGMFFFIANTNEFCKHTANKHKLGDLQYAKLDHKIAVAANVLWTYNVTNCAAELPDYVLRRFTKKSYHNMLTNAIF